jgi:hypothetical protein
MSTPLNRRRYFYVVALGRNQVYKYRACIAGMYNEPLGLVIRHRFSVPYTAAVPGYGHYPSVPFAKAKPRVANAVKTSLLGALLALSGCATCAQHPIACSIATAVVVGSIAASMQHHHDQQNQATYQRTFTQHLSPCSPQGVTPCGGP